LSSPYFNKKILSFGAFVFINSSNGGSYAMTHKHRQFVSHVRKHLKLYNGKLVIGRGKAINVEGSRCSGCFDDNNITISVARKAPNFLDVLLHEYCHFLQWIQKSKIYNTADRHCSIVVDWFGGKEYSVKTIKKAFYWVRKMERECEQFAVKLIHKYDLPIDKKKYIKQANCYIYTHFIMEETRKFWMFKKNPYKNKAVQKTMPSNFKAQSHSTLPKNIRTALLRCV